MHEAESFRKKAYPAFVTATRPPLPGTENVPVFMFHTVHPESFERQLQHLSRNGYRTIDTGELYSFLSGKTQLAGPSVMITFDDGERSLYRAAFPLLKKYGMKAVNFIVTGRVYETDRDRPNEGKQWLTWPEVLEMHAGGVIDFQSHTYLHETMFVGGELRDFIRPGLFTDELLVDRPMVRTLAGEQLLLHDGAPVYTMSPRMMDLPKYVDREDIRNTCIHYVAGHGGASFFHRPGWRRELTAVWNAAKGNGPAGTMEDAATQRAAMLDSLIRSREELAARLKKPVHHLAYPWASGGHLSVELSKEAGYLTNFWGPIPGQPENKPGQNPYSIARIKDDYLMRLPGHGRASLSEVLTMKARRRKALTDIY